MENNELHFRWAKEAWEFEQIHRLNYRTFVDEIPQHQPNAAGILVDAFDGENQYAICVRDQQILGMVAVRGNRPFSLDRKLANLDAYLPTGSRVCEIRLLAIEKRHRYGTILSGLIRLIASHLRLQGYDLAIISGTLRQLRLYRHLGFEPFGPQVGKSDALFQPMSLTWESFQKRMAGTLLKTGTEASQGVEFLPGPVTVRRSVQQAFHRAPASHRTQTFLRDFRQTKDRLCRLTKARYVTLLMGSGTLANEAMAAQLSLLSGRGLILAHGEFGERLMDHAKRWSLSFEVLEKPWGSVFQATEIETLFKHNPEIKWLWSTHCETSTGVLQNLDELKRLCDAHNIRLCLDSISSLGTLPVDLSGIFLASGVSGKGLGAYPGLCMVFSDHVPVLSASLPRYLDLGLYHAEEGVPFTFSSNLLAALGSALSRFETEEAFNDIERLSQTIRAQLAVWNCRLIAPQEHASPAVISFAPPVGTSARVIGRRLVRVGYRLSYQSAYLQERGWLQICLMGEISPEHVQSMLSYLGPLLCDANAVAKESIR